MNLEICLRDDKHRVVIPTAYAEMFSNRIEYWNNTDEHQEITLDTNGDWWHANKKYSFLTVHQRGTV